MPISEDEIDYNLSRGPQTTMSKAELRKTHKPIMEKRRRARINQCLNEIKSLILEAMNKDPSRHTKLEKADILEMAVKHLQNVQRQQLALAMASDPLVLRKFKSGFNECAAEIDKYINQVDGLDNSMKLRVSNHLHKCIGGIEQVAQFSVGGFNNVSLVPGTSSSQMSDSDLGNKNTNPRIQIPQGIQLIPSRLPTGELALLVPNSRNINFFPSNQRSSAFAAVVPTSTEISKPLSPPISPLSQEEYISRNRSPRGFRPVIPSKPTVYSEEHQVSQISSTAIQPLELKTLKFPISRKVESPKKVSEPLCIITNQAERYKHAQTKTDSVTLEENLRGVKRKCLDNPGLLTVVSDNLYPSPTAKILKPLPLMSECQPSSSCQKDDVTPSSEPSGSKDNCESISSDNMWRPW